MTVDHVGVSANISLWRLIRRKNKLHACSVQGKGQARAVLLWLDIATTSCFVATTEERKGLDWGDGGDFETKRKGSKCYGNSCTKPRMFCSLRTLLRWQWNHSEGWIFVMDWYRIKYIPDPHTIPFMCVYRLTDSFSCILIITYGTEQKVCLSSTDGVSMSEGRKWAEAAAATVRMGK